MYSHSRSIFNFPQKFISLFICFTFLSTSVVPPSIAQSLPAGQAGVIMPAMAQTFLPVPSPVAITPAFSPVLMRGVMIHPEDSLKFDFIIDRGQNKLQGGEFNQEANKLIKYFLASLTIPEKDMWVNLSPYEKDRIIPGAFGETEMGRDLLAQDYLLKQLTASLLMPEGNLGRTFWERVRTRAKEKFGTDDVPYDTFNKIWIVPEDAKVYENEKGAYVVGTHLKVLLEEDYLALEANQNSKEHGLGDVKKENLKPLTQLQTEVIREVLIPEIEKEVNEGETFSNLRQIYYSMVLASWYKQALKESLLGKVYVDKAKTQGVDIKDPKDIEKIYNQYVDAFKKGVAGIIKEDYDPATQEVVSRKYVTGGVLMKGKRARLTAKERSAASAAMNAASNDMAMVTTKVNEVGKSPDTNAVNQVEERILDLELKILKAKKQLKERVSLFVSNNEGVREEARQAIQQLNIAIAAKTEEIERLVVRGKNAKTADPQLIKHELMLQLKLLRLRRGFEHSIASDSMGSTNGRVAQAWKNIRIFTAVIKDIRKQMAELPPDAAMLGNKTLTTAVLVAALSAGAIVSNLSPTLAQDFSDPFDLTNPLSMLNPLNPLSPLSPFNIVWHDYESYVRPTIINGEITQYHSYQDLYLALDDKRFSEQDKLIIRQFLHNEYNAGKFDGNSDLLLAYLIINLEASFGEQQSILLRMSATLSPEQMIETAIKIAGVKKDDQISPIGQDVIEALLMPLIDNDSGYQNDMRILSIIAENHPDANIREKIKKRIRDIKIRDLKKVGKSIAVGILAVGVINLFFMLKRRPSDLFLYFLISSSFLSGLSPDMKQRILDDVRNRGIQISDVAPSSLSQEQQFAQLQRLVREELDREVSSDAAMIGKQEGEKGPKGIPAKRKKGERSQLTPKEATKNVEITPWKVYEAKDTGGFVLDSHGQLWVRDQKKSQLKIYDPKQPRFSILESDHLMDARHFSVDLEGRVWVTGSSAFDKLLRYEPETDTWTTIHPSSSQARIKADDLPEDWSVVRRPIDSIKTDPLGRTWILSREGGRVYREIYDPKKDDWKHVETDYTLGGGQFDAQGRIWIPQGRQFHIFDVDTETPITTGPGKERKPQSLSGENVFMYDYQTQSWKKKSFSQISIPVKDGPVDFVIAQDGKVWATFMVPTRLEVYDPSTKQWSVAGVMYENSYRKSPLALDPQGRVWVGDTSNEAVHVYDPQTNTWQIIGQYGDGIGEFEQPVAIKISKEGRVWIHDYSNDRIQSTQIISDKSSPKAGKSSQLIEDRSSTRQITDKAMLIERNLKIGETLALDKKLILPSTFISSGVSAGRPILKVDSQGKVFNITGDLPGEPLIEGKEYPFTIQQEESGPLITSSVLVMIKDSTIEVKNNSDHPIKIQYSRAWPQNSAEELMNQLKANHPEASLNFDKDKEEWNYSSQHINGSIEVHSGAWGWSILVNSKEGNMLFQWQATTGKVILQLKDGTVIDFDSKNNPLLIPIPKTKKPTTLLLIENAVKAMAQKLTPAQMKSLVINKMSDAQGTETDFFFMRPADYKIDPNRPIVKPSFAEQTRMTSIAENYPLIVTSHVAALMTILKLPGAYSKVKNIIKDNKSLTLGQIDALMDLYQELAQTTRNYPDIVNVLTMLEQRRTQIPISSFDKKELKVLEMAIKDTADSFAKRIFVSTAKQMRIILMVRASEGFGFGSRDKVLDSMRSNEIYVPEDLEGERARIQHYIDAGEEFYVSDSGESFLISDVNVDVIEGTNPFVGISMPLNVQGSVGGGMSTMTSGLGVRSLGNIPDTYMAQFITNLGDRKTAEEFNRRTVTYEKDGRKYTRMLKDPELYADRPELIIEYFKFLAEIRGQKLSELQEEIVVMKRDREEEFLATLRQIKEQYRMIGLKITTIEDGTVPHGLKGSLNREMMDALEGTEYNIHKTMITIGGSAEALMNLGGVSMLKNAGAVAGMRVYSSNVNEDEAGNKMTNHSRRYIFSDEEQTEMRQLRPHDAELIMFGDEKGERKLFTEDSVQGDVLGTFSFANNDQVLNQPGPVIKENGNIVVKVLRIGKIQGKLEVKIISEEVNPEQIAYDDAAMMTDERLDQVLKNLETYLRDAAISFDLINSGDAQLDKASKVGYEEADQRIREIISALVQKKRSEVIAMFLRSMTDKIEHLGAEFYGVKGLEKIKQYQKLFQVAHENPDRYENLIKDIDQIGLSTDFVKILRKKGINTVEDLTNAYAFQLRKIEDIRDGRIEILAEKLTSMGLSFKDPQTFPIAQNMLFSDFPPEVLNEELQRTLISRSFKSLIDVAKLSKGVFALQTGLRAKPADLEAINVLLNRVGLSFKDSPEEKIAADFNALDDVESRIRENTVTVFQEARISTLLKSIAETAKTLTPDNYFWRKAVERIFSFIRSTDQNVQVGYTTLTINQAVQEALYALVPSKSFEDGEGVFVSLRHEYGQLVQITRGDTSIKLTLAQQKIRLSEIVILAGLARANSDYQSLIDKLLFRMRDKETGNQAIWDSPELSLIIKSANDKLWDKTRPAFEFKYTLPKPVDADRDRAMTVGETPQLEVPVSIKALQKSYRKLAAAKEADPAGGVPVSDEFMPPIVKVKDKKKVGRIKKGDAVITFNFRRDRMEQLTRAFVKGESIDGFSSEELELMWVTMMEDEKGIIPDDQVAFLPIVNDMTLGKYLSSLGLRQFRIAETEKFKHITKFFNGGIEEAFPGEERVLVDSPDVERFDEKPEMSSQEITDKLIAAMKTLQHAFYLVNYAATDMVGHTGNLEAAIKAVEQIDKNLGELIAAAKLLGINILITADHGNIEQEWDKRNEAPHTQHTTNLVPFILVEPDGDAKQGQVTLRQEVGTLADVAPTLLETLGLKIPEEMTGKSLLQNYTRDTTKTSRTVLVVLDGFGINPDRSDESDATRKAHTPVIDELLKRRPNTQLDTSGHAAGVRKGQPGSSEVGHGNMGAGTIILQPQARVDIAIEDGTLFENAALMKAIFHAKKHGTALHLVGLVSAGGVHSDMEHIYALLELAKRHGIKEVYVHGILDGRDTSLRSGEVYIAALEAKMKEMNEGELVDMIGRFYAMDRNKNWDRTQKEYDLLVKGEAEDEWEDAAMVGQNQFPRGLMFSLEFRKEYLAAIKQLKNNLIDPNRKYIRGKINKFNSQGQGRRFMRSQRGIYLYSPEYGKTNLAQDFLMHELTQRLKLQLLSDWPTGLSESPRTVGVRFRNPLKNSSKGFKKLASELFAELDKIQSEVESIEKYLKPAADRAMIAKSQMKISLGFDHHPGLGDYFLFGYDGDQPAPHYFRDEKTKDIFYYLGEHEPLEPLSNGSLLHALTMLPLIGGLLPPEGAPDINEQIRRRGIQLALEDDIYRTPISIQINYVKDWVEVTVNGQEFKISRQDADLVKDKLDQAVDTGTANNVRIVSYIPLLLDATTRETSTEIMEKNPKLIFEKTPEQIRDSALIITETATVDFGKDFQISRYLIPIDGKVTIKAFNGKNEITLTKAQDGTFILYDKGFLESKGQELKENDPLEYSLFEENEWGEDRFEGKVRIRLNRNQIIISNLVRYKVIRVDYEKQLYAIIRAKSPADNEKSAKSSRHKSLSQLDNEGSVHFVADREVNTAVPVNIFSLTERLKHYVLNSIELGQIFDIATLVEEGIVQKATKELVYKVLQSLVDSKVIISLGKFHGVDFWMRPGPVSEVIVEAVETMGTHFSTWDVVRKLKLTSHELNLVRSTLGQTRGITYLGNNEWTTDSAELADNTTRGGIDLNSATMNMQIQRDGNGVPLPVNLQNLENLNIQGFQPVIINVVPITNLPLLLGLNSQSSDNPVETSQESLSVVDRFVRNPS